MGEGDGAFVMDVEAESKLAAVFDAYLRAFNALNIGDRIGTFSYVDDPDLITCAQTRRHGQSKLKCKFDAR